MLTRFLYITIKNDATPPFRTLQMLKISIIIAKNIAATNEGKLVVNKLLNDITLLKVGYLMMVI